MGTPRVWQLQTAKNRFSEVVDRAISEGPQVVTRRGREAAVLVGIDRYRALVGERRPARSFAEHLLSVPKVRGGVHTVRQRDTGRKLDLG
jgi:prevent-host-death family protein